MQVSTAVTNVSSSAQAAAVTGAWAAPLPAADIFAGAGLVGRVVDDLATLLIAVAAGSAGFLVHNWPPARIFMGDAGSGVPG